MKAKVNIKFEYRIFFVMLMIYTVVASVLNMLFVWDNSNYGYTNGAFITKVYVAFLVFVPFVLNALAISLENHNSFIILRLAKTQLIFDKIIKGFLMLSYVALTFLSDAIVYSFIAALSFASIVIEYFCYRKINSKSKEELLDLYIASTSELDEKTFEIYQKFSTKVKVCILPVLFVLFGLRFAFINDVALCISLLAFCAAIAFFAREIYILLYGKICHTRFIFAFAVSLAGAALTFLLFKGYITIPFYPTVNEGEALMLFMLSFLPYFLDQVKIQRAVIFKNKRKEYLEAKDYEIGKL